jgi:hypothetical protein
LFFPDITEDVLLWRDEVVYSSFSLYRGTTLASLRASGTSAAGSDRSKAAAATFRTNGVGPYDPPAPFSQGNYYLVTPGAVAAGFELLGINGALSGRTTGRARRLPKELGVL